MQRNFKLRLLVYMPFTKPVVQYALKLFRWLRNKFGR